MNILYDGFVYVKGVPFDSAQDFIEDLQVFSVKTIDDRTDECGEVAFNLKYEINVPQEVADTNSVRSILDLEENRLTRMLRMFMQKDDEAYEVELENYKVQQEEF